MNKLSVVIHPNKILNQTATAFDNFDAETKRIAEDMVYTMQEADNAGGLAGPQVSISKRIFVFDQSENKDSLRVCINPEVLAFSDDTSVMEEGCLSIPFIGVPVKRPNKVQVAYYDVNGKRIEEELDGIDSRCFQHELDHLDGILTFDRLAPLKRSLILKKYRMLIKKYQDQIPT